MRFGHRAKRWLYLIHRWLGIGSCILFAMWFFSGLVMIYVPFPALTKSERLVGLSPIDWASVHSTPGPRLRAGDAEALPRAFLLEMRGDRPVWRITDAEGDEQDVAARDGRPMGAVDAAEARKAAALFGHAPVVGLDLIARDQWTVAGGFDRHRPLWKAALGGPGGRILHVSSRTGAILLDTNASERFWNWLGSVPHWLYPTVLRQSNAAWRQVVMWVSAPCIVAAATGFWIGILRTRLGRRRFKAGRIIPYRGWMAWHHIAGLIGGLFLIAWIFSGWLSVDPFRLFASGGIAAANAARYESRADPPTIDMAVLAHRTAGARRVTLRWFAGQPLLEVEAPGRRDILDARTLQPVAFDPLQIAAQASRLIPGARVAGVERLTEPDAYWYDAVGEPVLPVLRVRFADPARVWIHIDPADGAILGTLDARGRLYRWLFDLLHKWDLNVLTRHRPAWDVLLWLLSLAGVVTSISGIRIGWARLRRSP